MCGLSGIIYKNSTPNQKHIINMNGMINHRGPNQSGYLEFKNILLGHVRLPVMDPRNVGRQPMSNDERYSIVFNGEVFNYHEIREKLIKKNFRFYTHTDTEVVLNAFKEWGINSFDMFNGDWVISILDKEENTLTLARDQLGTKPCFIFENSNVISFCSEIKGFMGLEEDLKFDEDHLGISQITLFEFSKTKFKNVSQLEPGMLIIIDLKSLERKKIRWFNPLENLLNIHPNYEVNQGEYYQRVYDATKLRLNADLKIGTSLSGGLDSSTIFTVLNLIEKEQSIKNKLDLNPTIIDYKGNKTTKHAINLANKFSREYNLVSIGQDISLENLSKQISQLEITEEFNKQLILYEKQKSLGIDVSIDGLGPDEFLGLPSFIFQLSQNTYNNIVESNEILNTYGTEQQKEQIKRIFGGLAEAKQYLQFNFENLINKKNYFSKYIFSEPKNLNFDKSKLLINKDLEMLKNFNLEFQFTYFRTHCGFVQLLLSKWDRASMASAVEIRSPFLDKNVYLYSLSLPLEKKIKNGKLKSILRDSFDSLLPKEIINQNFRQGLARFKRNLNSDTNLGLINEIINQNNFRHSNIWNSKKIIDDFNQKNNIDNIWEISKFYLMQEEFKTRLTDVKNNFKHKFEIVKKLS